MLYFKMKRFLLYIVPYDIFNTVIYVTLTVLTKHWNMLFLFSYHLRALIFFVNEVSKL